MARKLRIQYEGAIYHVINRGNYRRDVFESVGAAQAFEDALKEACAANGWRMQAYVIMRNHYHLVVETPRANLVEGMHWLQSTFATRFNRLRKERGHLFQGRYQALLIENTAALANVVDYVHLNPVRAKIIGAEQLGGFRWSSLRRFMREGRTAWLSCADWLAQRGFADSESGWRDYLAYLIGLAADEDAQKRLGLVGLSVGWAIGSNGWKRALAQDHAQRALAPGIEAGELKELKMAHWSQVLDAELRRAGKTKEDARVEINGAPWKIQAAIRLRGEGAPYAWITEMLSMGKVSSVRAYMAKAKSSI